MRSLIVGLKPKTYATLMVITIGLAGQARAKILVGESLDWLTIARPHVAIVEVSVSDPENKTEAKSTNLTIKTRLKKVLKGQPPESAEFVRLWQMSARPGQQDNARPENGWEYLLFFDEQRHVIQKGQAIDKNRRANLIGPGAIGQLHPITSSAPKLPTTLSPFEERQLALSKNRQAGLSLGRLRCHSVSRS